MAGTIARVTSRRFTEIQATEQHANILCSRTTDGLRNAILAELDLGPGPGPGSTSPYGKSSNSSLPLSPAPAPSHPISRRPPRWWSGGNTVTVKDILDAIQSKDATSADFAALQLPES
ncbi:hypothetical protein ACFV2N_45335, partial [Streptomyces sp. NPDC059680]